MTLEIFLAILILLLAFVIFMKMLRKIFAVLICLLLLYFIYFNFFTWEGAVKFGTFVETVNMDSYRIDIKEIYQEEKRKDFIIDPLIKSDNGEKSVKYLTCKSHGPVKLCEKKG